tara:strand:+ start:110 stop:637 length:528 start_codon:yes stop_codon:yes gene_type:complete
MSDIIDRLRELSVDAEDCLALRYSEGCDVWHINESHVQESVAETGTASMLAGLLASGVPIYGTWGSAEPGCDILNEMRSSGALEDYDYEGWFEEYLAEKLAETIYEGEYSLEYSTTQYDYKRGRCDISTEVRVRAGDLYDMVDFQNESVAARTPERLLSGFEVSIQTKNGTLTLD